MIRANAITPVALVTPERNLPLAEKPVVVCQAYSLEIVRGVLSAKFSQRVLLRLAEARDKEREPWACDDLAIAFGTVVKADEGHPDPWGTAFYQVLGISPDKLIPFLVARAKADADPFWPESMLPFRYTLDWPSQFLRGQAIADKARTILPPKKAQHSVPFNISKANQKGQISWPVIVCAVCFVALLLGVAIKGWPKSYFYTYPTNYLRIVQKLNERDFMVQRVDHGVPQEQTMMRFCDDYLPWFEGGHILQWIRYDDHRSCQSMGPEDRGFDILRDASGMPVLPPNCRFDQVNNHIVCEGGKPKF